MTTTYTNIPKPSGTSYLNVGLGAYLFDDFSVSFDGDIPFDGAYETYSSVAKASGTTYTNIPKAT